MDPQVSSDWFIYPGRGKRVLKEGGSGRREAVEKAEKSVGGSVESFYFAFGEDDFYIIGDFPDNISAAAVSQLARAAGTSKLRTVVLLTPEEIDQASKKTATYRPPGH